MEMEAILQSMGVENADPLVAFALQEYANRFASGLLCDSKDYANHAGHIDIDVGDAKTAITMSDIHIMGSDPREKIMIDMQSTVNAIDLAKVVDDKCWLIRYPKDASNSEPTKSLLQLTYTIVPSTEALQQFQEMGEYQGNQTDSFQPMHVTN